MKSTSITPTLSQNTVTITFPADCWDLNFFERGEVGWHHSIDALFDSDLKWWTQVSSLVTIRCKKILSVWQYSRSSEQASRQDCVQASVSCLGIHLAHTFEYPRVSVIFTALPALTPNDSASSLIVMRLFFLINASAWSMLAELWAEDGLPLLGLSQRCLQQVLSVHHWFASPILSLCHSLLHQHHTLALAFLCSELFLSLTVEIQ